MKSRIVRFLKSGLFFASVCLNSTADAAWDPVESADLEAITNNMTWEGDGWIIYWKQDHTRELIAGEKTFQETWDIRENGTVLCSDGADRGERCGIVEVKKNKYRSKRISGAKKGKGFKFKVTPTR